MSGISVPKMSPMKMSGIKKHPTGIDKMASIKKHDGIKKQEGLSSWHEGKK